MHTLHAGKIYTCCTLAGYCEHNTNRTFTITRKCIMKLCTRCENTPAKEKGLCRKCMTLADKRAYGLLCHNCDNRKRLGGYCRTCAKTLRIEKLLCTTCKKTSPVRGGRCQQCMSAEEKQRIVVMCNKCEVKRRTTSVGGQHKEWGKHCRDCMSVKELGAVRAYNKRIKRMCIKCGVKQRVTSVGEQHKDWGKHCRGCVSVEELEAIRSYERSYYNKNKRTILSKKRKRNANQRSTAKIEARETKRIKKEWLHCKAATST